MMKPAPDLLNWTYSPDMRVETRLHRLFDAYPPRLRGDLSRVQAMLARLGNPHRTLPPIFHAAGTNGKGSTLAFVQAILEAGGLSVHKFTSPHLVRFEERLVFNGQDVSPDRLLALIDAVDAACHGEEISFFEFFTILFFVEAAQRPADAVLLEVGLGGLFDSTNVIDSCAAAIITRLSYDHTHLLGLTLPEIAAQKAGIIKRGCPVVISPQPDAGAAAALQAAAEGLQAPVAAWSVTPSAAGFEYKSAQRRLWLPLPALPGAHQVVNAGTAIAAVEQTDFAHRLNEESVARAMRHVRWPGRWQRLTEGALAALLPPGWELWLDGAHNDSGAEALAAELAHRRDDKPLHILTAFKGKKNPDDFYGPLQGHAATVQVIAGALFSDMPSVPMVAPAALTAHLEKLGFKAALAPNLESAIQSLVFQFQAPQRILVTGSLYLVGHALKVNG